MIVSYKFKKKKCLHSFLANRREIYAVDSLYGDVSYLYDGEKFGMISSIEAKVCEFDEVPELVKLINIKCFRKECLSVWEDIKQIRKELRNEF